MTNGRHANPNRFALHVARAVDATLYPNLNGKPVVANCEINCNGKFSAVWHKTGKDVVARFGYAPDMFEIDLRQLREKGYALVDVEPYVIDESVFWDAIYRKGYDTHEFFRDLSKNQFVVTWQQQSRNGLRLDDLETYVVNGVRKWAGLFRPGTGNHRNIRYYSTAAFQRKVQDLLGLGYQLIDVEVFYELEKLKWVGVWAKRYASLGTTTFTLHDTLDQFKNRKQDFASIGWKLTDLERYETKSKGVFRRGSARWAAIWKKYAFSHPPSRSFPATRVVQNQQYCGTKDDQGDWSAKGITNLHNDWRSSGYEMIDWERD